MFRGLGMLFGRREEQVYRSIEEYIALVLEAAEGIRALREAVKVGEYGKVQLVYSEIDAKETEADELRRRLSESLSQGSFFSHLREDLLSLVEEIDNIADSAKDAVKTLMEMEPDWNLVKFLFEQPEMDEYVDLCVEIVEKLAEAVKALKVGGPKVTPLLHEIEEIEERADEVRSVLTRKVLGEAKKYDVLNVLQVKEMLYLLDNLCDSAEDSSDRILMIIAKGYG